MFDVGDSVKIQGRMFVVVGFDNGQAILMDDENNTLKRWL